MNISKHIKYLSLITLFYCQVTYSLTCPGFSVSRSKNPIEKTANLTHVIFIGEAIATTKKTFRTKGYEEAVVETSTRFEINESLKGKTKKTILINGNIDGDCGCNYVFEPGVKYLVFANEVSGSYQTVICQSILSVSDALFLETIEKVKGEVKK